MASDTKNMSDAYNALTYLDGYCWTLFTCDVGYGCVIYTSPEHGDEELSRGYGDTIDGAIKAAVSSLKKKSGLEVESS